MREVFEEYGKVVVASVSSLMLIGFAAAFLATGQVFDVILAFSQHIC